MHRGPLSVHLAVLAAGLVAYSVYAAGNWFFYDDWYFLVQHPDVIWSPHVGHWSTVPALVFLSLRAVFGIDHYLPFALPAILAHLAVVHFVWRLSIRSGVRPWVATAFSVLFTFLGAGAEALAWAVQIGFVGAVAGMLAAVLLLDTGRLTLVRGCAVAMIVLLSVASSGVALPFVVSAIALSWMRHGLRRTAAVFAVPLCAYLVWFVVERGLVSPPGFGAIQDIPRFAVALLSDGLGRMFPVTVLGGLLFAALAIWWIFTVRDARSRGLAAYLLFPAAPLFAVLTASARATNGIATASSSRYVYVAVIAIAPFMAICFDLATRRARLGPAIALVLVVAVWNAGGAAEALAVRAHRVGSTRAELARAAAELRSAPASLPPDERPSPRWAPDVTAADLRLWIARGWYQPG